MTNPMPTACGLCGLKIPQNGGTFDTQSQTFRHLACQKNGRASVAEVRFAGESYIQNIAGKCEDAPCCGCCTI